MKDNYQEIKTLGKGAFGEVILVENIQKKEFFAMKQIEKQLLNKEQKQYQAYIEKTVLTKIKHFNIINMVQSFQDDYKLFFIMEYCSGGSLSDYIKNIPDNLKIDTIQFYCGQILNALQHLHSQGIVHRDLKPENIILTKDRHIKLIDFGTCLIKDKSIFDQKTKKNIEEMRERAQQQNRHFEDFDDERRPKLTFVGTCEYVSPELLKDDECDAPADVWAFGCLLYKLFTKKTPFYDQTEYLIFQRIQTLQYEMNDKIPQVVQDLLRKIFVRYPKDRITIQEIKQSPFFEGVDFDKLNDREPPKEILLKGLAGWVFYKQRLLILYNNKTLEYLDPSKGQVKGLIQLTPDIIVEQKDNIRWTIQIPSRTYYFKSQENETPQWVATIKNQIQKY